MIRYLIILLALIPLFSQGQVAVIQREVHNAGGSTSVPGGRYLAQHSIGQNFTFVGGNYRLKVYSGFQHPNEEDLITAAEPIATGVAFEVFPTLVENELSISSPEAWLEGQIFSSKGELVQSFTRHGDLTTLQLEGLEPGAYICQLRGAFGTRTEKLLKY